ncbi:hypothetical protein ACLBSJ_22720, partial [Klebsiella pneumoniae]|uniref:hypothetical protein n=1 Tax=Klebsiella pneumoniae TaxID=573 RepID=UPI003969957A
GPPAAADRHELLQRSLAGALYQIAASFNPALYAAALALLIAAGLVFTERQA